MKVFVLSSNSGIEGEVWNETRVFHQIEKAKAVFQETLKEIKKTFPEDKWSDNICAASGDFETSCSVQDVENWWSLAIDEKEVE